MTLPLTISSCSLLKPTVVLSKECTFYRDFKIQVDCTGVVLPEGMKCGDIVTEDTKRAFAENRLNYLEICKDDE